MVYSDTFSSYTGVAAEGYVRRLVDHSARFSDGAGSHFNGPDGFWRFLKRGLVAKGGICSLRLPLYLAEYL
ncbi:MAG: transposase [Chloroflexi bacterium]|nr:transposase [Chloroflexota bacterium]